MQSQIKWFLIIVIIGFLITFMASLIFNRLKTAAIQEANIYLRTNIFNFFLNQRLMKIDDRWNLFQIILDILRF